MVKLVAPVRLPPSSTIIPAFTIAPVTVVSPLTVIWPVALALLMLAAVPPLRMILPFEAAALVIPPSATPPFSCVAPLPELVTAFTVVPPALITRLPVFATAPVVVPLRFNNDPLLVIPPSAVTLPLNATEPVLVFVIVFPAATATACPKVRSPAPAIAKLPEAASISTSITDAALAVIVAPAATNVSAEEFEDPRVAFPFRIILPTVNASIISTV